MAEFLEDFRKMNNLLAKAALPYLAECLEGIDNLEKLNDDVELWFSVNSIINGGGPHCQSSEEVLHGIDPQG